MSALSILTFVCWGVTVISVCADVWVGRIEEYPQGWGFTEILKTCNHPAVIRGSGVRRPDGQIIQIYERTGRANCGARVEHSGRDRLLQMAAVSSQQYTLPYADTGDRDRYDYQPLRECSQLCGVNRKLTRIFGQPSIIGATLFLGFTLFIIHIGFGLYYTGRQYTGIVAVVAGFALALSGGFATIGEGPLGWITWIIS